MREIDNFVPRQRSFKDLNDNNDNTDELPGTFNIDITDDDEIFDSSITEGEILKCFKALKNNKASANDNIINEYIKSSQNVMLPIYSSCLYPPRNRKHSFRGRGAVTCFHVVPSLFRPSATFWFFNILKRQ